MKNILLLPTDFQVKSYIRSSQLFIAYTNNGLYSFLNVAGNKFSMPNSVLMDLKSITMYMQQILHLVLVTII